MSEINWLQYMGCSGWFNPNDAFFEIVSHTKTIKTGSNNGPVWMVVGEKDDDILISVNGVNISKCPKKYVRILEPKE